MIYGNIKYHYHYHIGIALSSSIYDPMMPSAEKLVRLTHR